MGPEPKPDYWAEGYRAGLAGKQYTDNPHEGREGGTAWAFGCGAGWHDRNRKALAELLAKC